VESFLDPSIRQDIQEGGLAELDAQCLLKRFIEDRIAGFVLEVR
jgi:hypothetical protein